MDSCLITTSKPPQTEHIIMYHEKITFTINQNPVDVYHVNNDVNGNPRYVIHYLNIADDYSTALSKAKEHGGKAYRAKWFGGGIVLQSFNLEHDVRDLLA